MVDNEKLKLISEVARASFASKMIVSSCFKVLGFAKNHNNYWLNVLVTFWCSFLFTTEVHAMYKNETKDNILSFDSFLFTTDVPAVNKNE